MRRGALRPSRDALLASALACTGCSPSILIGTDNAAASASDTGSDVVDAGLRDIDATDATTDDVTVDMDADLDADGLVAIDFPWTTSFENGDADYSGPQGYCYDQGGATHMIVSGPSIPVHTGTHSMAFTVIPDASVNASQSRCVRQGVLPETAYYGAWYYLPGPVANFGLWNLIHFEGGDSPSATRHGLWDVSLINDSDGGVRVWAYNFLGKQNLDAGVPPIPIGTWFQLEVYWRRDNGGDAGEFALYKDKQLALDVKNIQTDNTSWGQFYVGDFANFLVPANVTLYVDDVSIGATP